MVKVWRTYQNKSRSFRKKKLTTKIAIDQLWSLIHKCVLGFSKKNYKCAFFMLFAMSEKENSLGVGLWKIEFLYFLWIDFSFSCFFIKHRYSMNFHNHLVWFHSLTKIFKRKIWDGIFNFFVLFLCRTSFSTIFTEFTPLLH